MYLQCENETALVLIFKGNHSPTLVVKNKILPVPS